MAFVAPVLAEGAATGETAAAASGARAAGASRATTGGAASARTARSAASVPSATAASRADELVASGQTRTKARRTLRAEYGATAEQADDLLDAAGARAPEPAPPADDGSSGQDTTGSRPSSTSTPPRMPRSITRGADAGGGLLLGVMGYILGTVYLRGGGAGLKAWFNAKFLNKTTDQTTTQADQTKHVVAKVSAASASSATSGLTVMGTAAGSSSSPGRSVPGAGRGAW